MVSTLLDANQAVPLTVTTFPDDPAAAQKLPDGHDTFHWQCG